MIIDVLPLLHCTLLCHTILSDNTNLPGQHGFCFIILRLIRPFLIIQKNYFEIVFFLFLKKKNENEEIEVGEIKSLNFVQ
jgi:hypothetical protein